MRRQGLRVTAGDVAGDQVVLDVEEDRQQQQGNEVQENEPQPRVTQQGAVRRARLPVMMRLGGAGSTGFILPPRLPVCSRNLPRFYYIPDAITTIAPAGRSASRPSGKNPCGPPTAHPQ
jgi:hypothetical protein